MGPFPDLTWTESPRRAPKRRLCPPESGRLEVNTFPRGPSSLGLILRHIQTTEELRALPEDLRAELAPPDIIHSKVERAVSRSSLRTRNATQRPRRLRTPHVVPQNPDRGLCASSLHPNVERLPPQTCVCLRGDGGRGPPRPSHAAQAHC
ncbi:hypothetical protein EYF80_035650 [Liparis tanakae]|uniref:Uncharacterized protein n=1 Tax=Liparis tanakae TaxID=230148 RepID=A0A4Z2GNA4_9TELE|nr:hypothetical protein EYF80_035650 [Liparis tanakae]